MVSPSSRWKAVERSPDIVSGDIRRSACMVRFFHGVNANGKIDIILSVSKHSTAAIPNHLDFTQRIDTNARRSIRSELQC